MATQNLYELQHNSSFFRLTDGESVTIDGYRWVSCNVESLTDDFLKITDESGGLLDWVNKNAVSRFYLTKKTYDDSMETIVEVVKNLYIMNENSSSENWVLFRKSSIPVAHLEDSNKLVADGIVQLFEVKLTDGSYLWLKQDNDIHWNGRDWTGVPLSFEGYSSATGETLSRPTLSVVNPDGAWSTFIRDGLITRAVCTRYLVLYDDLINDRPIFQKRTWIIWYPRSLTRQYVQFELRNPMDGVNFDVPARMYMPPEFPFVDI